MPISNVKTELGAIARQLGDERARDTRAKVSWAVLDKVAALVGEKNGVSARELGNNLQSGRLNPEQKLKLVSGGIDAADKAALTEFIADPRVTAMLTPEAANFLKALAGTESLRPDLFSTAATEATGPSRTTSRAAVQKMRDLIARGQLDSYYEAVLGLRTPELKAEAEKLFSELPKMTGESTADDFVAAGLWTQKPKGIDQVQTAPRYMPGRQVIVMAPVHSDLFSPEKFLTWKEDGIVARTHKARLTGEDGEDFLVALEGRAEPYRVKKAEVYALNHPQQWPGDKATVQGKVADYDSPLMKAKVAEAAIKMDRLVGQLDFTQEGKRGLFGFGRSTAGQALQLQMKCVRVIHDAVVMRYSAPPDAKEKKWGGEWSERSDSGRQAIRGVGVCNEQGGVTTGLLNPFLNALGVDAQVINGGVYRDVSSRVVRALEQVARAQGMEVGKDTNQRPLPGTAWAQAQGARVSRGQLEQVVAELKAYDGPNKDRVAAALKDLDPFNPFASGGHTWIQLTYRPSGDMRVLDRTWANAGDLEIGAAYSRRGDRYPSRVDGEPYSWGKQSSELAPAPNLKPLSSTDVNFTGKQKTAVYHGVEPTEGLVGRENHISIREREEDERARNHTPDGN
jgi:hypothetical protein